LRPIVGQRAGQAQGRTGLVEVTQDGAVLRREGPGDLFGEIGLLRDVPRSATVTAVEDTVLQSGREVDRCHHGIAGFPAVTAWAGAFRLA
jgi:hypothetical protein